MAIMGRYLLGRKDVVENIVSYGLIEPTEDLGIDGEEDQGSIDWKR